MLMNASLLCPDVLCSSEKEKVRRVAKYIEIKTLRAWLFVNRIKFVDFAKMVGCSETFIWNCVGGRRAPSLGLAKIMSDATKGKLSTKYFRHNMSETDKKWEPKPRKRNIRSE